MNMKKIVYFLACMVIVFSLSSCGGNVKHVNIIDVDSKRYTSDDINSAIGVIINEFDKRWNGCTLKEIVYIILTLHRFCWV